jgi:hypothetical protein
MGISFAIYRFKEGQIIRGVAELASAGVACLPGYGTAISVAIDIGLGGYDIYEICSEDNSTTLNVNANPYQVLGLTQEPPPSRAEVDEAYRKMMLQMHPDKLRQYGEQIEAQVTNMTQVLSLSKDTIYTERGWV